MKGFTLEKALAQQANCQRNRKVVDKDIDAEYCSVKCKRCARWRMKYRK